jgi:transcriptional regulator with XRE-family HTH domain
MKPSFLRHPVAVLRKICELYQKEFAELIGCSRVYVQKIEQTPEHGGQPLSKKLAMRIFHETQASPAWLLAANPKAPAIAADGTPYSLEIFHKAQADKQWYDQPHPFSRRTEAMTFCAQLIAILEHANAQKKYQLAIYKLAEAIKKLQQEFGQDLRIYSVTDPNHIAFGSALKIFRQLVAHGQKPADVFGDHPLKIFRQLVAHGQKPDEGARRLAAVTDAQKKQSFRQTGRKRKRA